MPGMIRNHLPFLQTQAMHIENIDWHSLFQDGLGSTLFHAPFAGVFR
jgi:hypothetical protein